MAARRGISAAVLPPQTKRSLAGWQLLTIPHQIIIVKRGGDVVDEVRLPSRRGRETKRQQQQQPVHSWMPYLILRLNWLLHPPIAPPPAHSLTFPAAQHATEPKDECYI